MIRLRARFLALCVLGMLPVSTWSASIPVTTPFDIEVNGDDLCSLRESVTASRLAQVLNLRKSADSNFKRTLEALEKVLLDIQQGEGNVTYPRSEMLEHVAALMREAEEAGVNVHDTGLLERVQRYQDKVAALGTSRGLFDLSAADAYPGPSERQLGYYTHHDTSVPIDASVTLNDPLNLSGGSITYFEGDRAFWDGTNWRRYAKTAFPPTEVDETSMQEAIALHERIIVAEQKAIDRITADTEVDGCSDGSSFDTVNLENDTVYFLNKTLELPLRLTLRGGKNSVIARCVSGACAVAPAFPPGIHRLLTVPVGGNIEIINLTLRNGDAGASADGGAVHASSTLVMNNVRLEGNHARSGGALFLADTATLTSESVVFVDNNADVDGGAISSDSRSLKLTDFRFGDCAVAAASCTAHGNIAGGKGGAIAFRAVSTETSSTLQLSRGAFVGNRSGRGSAIYVSGVDVIAEIENATIAENVATTSGTLDFEMAVDATGRIDLNNLTMVRNSATSGSAGIVMNEMLELRVRNSVVADNTGAGAPFDTTLWDCDLPPVLVGAVPAVPRVARVPAANFTRNYFSANSFCPGLRFGDPASVPESENFVLVLAPDADPRTFMLGEILKLPMDPALGPYFAPVFPGDVNDSLENRLVNRGAGSQEFGRCAEKDQRGFERSSSVDEQCDIGAVEYQIGRRKDDSFEMLVDERRCIDVISDDLGDSLYQAGTLRVVLPIERPGATAVVVNRVADSTACSNWADIPHDEAILFTPASGFRGETTFIYGFDWETADPAVVPGAVRGSVTGVTRVATESRGGFASYTIGALPASLVFLLGMLGMRRRIGVGSAALLALVFMAVPAQAVDTVIYVNSSLDEPLGTTPGDGRCTLREALNTARNDQANMSGGDCLNGNEGPDIIEFAPSLSEVVLEASVIAYGSVTLRCPTPDANEDGTPSATPLQTCTIRRREFDLNPDGTVGTTPNTNKFRLIDSLGSLTIHRVTLQGGLAPEVGSGQEGGAIYSAGSVSIVDSVFLNNRAVSGGAIFLAGIGSSLSISGTVFRGNTSRAGISVVGGAPVGLSAQTASACPLLGLSGPDGLIGTRSGGGGAIATTQGDNHKISILSSSFVDNCSAAGGAAVDLNTRATVVIANSTFSGNISTQGPVVDLSGAQGAVLRNLTVVGNRSGIAVTPDFWDPVGGSLQRRTLQYGLTSVTLTSSIVAANVAESDASIATNCSAVLSGYSHVFNVFGDEDDPAGGPFATPDAGYTCAGDPLFGNQLLRADAVFNAAVPASGLISVLQPITAGNVELPMHVVIDPAAATGVLVNAGYIDPDKPQPVDSQVDPAYGLSVKCANIDARGASRTSGGRCDVGALEALNITAVEDNYGNSGRQDRLVVMDLIANDVFDEAIADRKIKIDCDTAVAPVATPAGRRFSFVGADSALDADGAPDVCIEVTVPTGEVGDIDFLRRDVLADLHVIRGIPADTQIMVSMLPRSWVTGLFPDDYVAGWDRASFATPAAAEADALRLAREYPVTEAMLAPGYEVVFDNGGVIRDEINGGAVVLSYRAYTVGQSLSNSVDVIVTVDNVPPTVVDDTVTIALGASVTIDLLANDSDADPSAAGLKITNITGTGCKPVPDPFDLEVTLYYQCEFGRVTLNAAKTSITWQPDNAFNPFTQDLSYDVIDQDPLKEKGAKGAVKIIVDRSDASAGGIFGEDDLSDILGIDFLGAPGGLFLMLVMLGGARRR